MRHPFKVSSLSDTRIAVLLWIAFVFLYASTASGVLEFGDDWSMLYVTRSIVQHGGVDVPPDAPGAYPGRDGRYYSKYGLGQSVVGIPFYLTGIALARLEGRPTESAGHLLQASSVTYAETFAGVLSTAAAVAVLFLLCRALDFTTRSSVLTALALGTATFAWNYSRTFMTEPSSMLALVAAWYGLVKWSRRGGARWLVFAGSAAGWTMLLHLSTIVAVPAMGLWLLWTLFDRNLTNRKRIAAIASWTAPVLFACLVTAGYNLFRFGRVMDTGYGPLSEHLTNPMWVGLYGFMLSPGKSIFMYAPILIASAMGWPELWRRDRKLAAGVGLMVASHLAFHSCLSYWWGGGGWGPRYAAVLLPVLLLGLPTMLERRGSPWRSLAWLGLSAVSVVVQIASVIVPNVPYEAEMEATPTRFGQLLWDPPYSPVRHHLGALWRMDYPPALAFTYFQAPHWFWVQALELVIATGLIAACLRLGVRVRPVSSQ